MRTNKPAAVKTNTTAAQVARQMEARASDAAWTRAAAAELALRLQRQRCARAAKSDRVK